MASLSSEVVPIPSSILLRHLSQSMKNVALWWQGRPLSNVMAALPLESRFSRGRKLPRALQACSWGERLPPWQSLPAIPKRCKNFFCLTKTLLSDMHWGTGVSRLCTKMAGEALEKAGMHFDDLNRIRVLDEDTASQVSSDYQFGFQTHPISNQYFTEEVWVEKIWTFTKRVEFNLNVHIWQGSNTI